MAEVPSDPAPSHAGFQPELRIDWLDGGSLRDGLPGRLGMTFLPGKRGPSTRYPGHVYRRVLADDLAALRRGALALLVLLVEDAELERWSDVAFAQRAAEASVPLLREPLPDGSPPRSMEVMDRLLARIAAARGSGDVAVACMGGVGRTGTVVAAALIAAGHTVPEALAIVRRTRHPRAVETAAQERFLERYAAHVARRTESPTPDLGPVQAPAGRRRLGA